jgi:hypothetical protein
VRAQRVAPAVAPVGPVEFGVAGPYRVPVGAPGRPLTFSTPQEAVAWVEAEEEFTPGFTVVLVLPDGTVAR